LIGTTLMNTPDPTKLVADLLSAGREKAMSLNTRRMRATQIPRA
jgi:hypothetical protein